MKVLVEAITIRVVVCADCSCHVNMALLLKEKDGCCGSVALSADQ